jgi:hypothetical protein
MTNLRKLGRRILVAGMFVLFASVEVQAQDNLNIKNTARQVKPGVYECIVYLDIDRNAANEIYGVTYTLPPGYPNRKLLARKTRPGIKGYFSSNPFWSTEEAIVSVQIDRKGKNPSITKFKLKLFASK